MHRLDWNDLRYLLAVAEHGSLARAARVLAVNHSTVLRRIGRFEQQLSVRLFERLPTGYVLTAAGEALANSAREISETVTAVERRIVGEDLRLSGNVRVTTTDTLALWMLPPMLQRFAAAHPAVQVELAIGNAQADLSRREADVAIRPTLRPPDHLLGRRVCRVGYAPYAAASYLEQHRARSALPKHIWVAPDESMATSVVGTYMQSRLPRAAISFRANSLAVLARAAQAGLGVALLPCYLGESTGLTRIRDPLAEVGTDLWLLSHADLRKNARVRALLEFLTDALGEQSALIEGRATLGRRSRPISGQRR